MQLKAVNKMKEMISINQGMKKKTVAIVDQVKLTLPINLGSSQLFKIC